MIAHVCVYIGIALYFYSVRTTLLAFAALFILLVRMLAASHYLTLSEKACMCVYVCVCVCVCVCSCVCVCGCMHL